MMVRLSLSTPLAVGSTICSSVSTSISLGDCMSGLKASSETIKSARFSSRSLQSISGWGGVRERGGERGKSEYSSDREEDGEASREFMHGEDTVDMADERASQPTSGGLLRVRRHLLQRLEVIGICVKGPKCRCLLAKNAKSRSQLLGSRFKGAFGG